MKKLVLAALPLLMLSACDNVDTDTDTAIDTTPDTLDEGNGMGVIEGGGLVNEVPPATADMDSDDGVVDPSGATDG